MLHDIKWDVFTAEEKGIIEKLVENSGWEMITSAIMVDSAEKEHWVAQILEQVRPEVKPLESKVEKEMLEAMSKGEKIDTPEKEAEWQKKIDEEVKTHNEQLKSKRKPKKDTK